MELDDIWLEKMAKWKRFSRIEKRRLYRIFMVVAVGFSYFIDVLLLVLFLLAGTIDYRVILCYAGAALGHVALFSTLHWSGFSDRFTNTQLTEWQMAYAIGVQLMGIAIAPQLTQFFLGIMFVVFAFSVLRISLRAALVAWLLACISIVFVMSLFGHADMGIIDPNGLEILAVWLSFTLILLRCIGLGYYATAVRMQIYQMSHSLEQAKNQAEHQAAHDTLTGALTRRAILPLIVKQIALSREKGQQSCVAMLDLDRFKAINDRLGHLIGDEVLKKLVRCIAGITRESDRLGRYGGEEFILLLSRTRMENALQLMERIREAITREVTPMLTENLQVTVSIGITEIRAEDSLEIALERADRALYNAKRSGRNRVCQV